MAFQKLFDRHAGSGLGYARRLVNDTATAEDLLQDTWMKIVRLAPNYTAQGQFKSWFLTLIRNSAFNFLRGQKRLSFSDSAHETATDHTPEIDVLKSERHRLLSEKIEALPENQRLALLLWAIEDLDYESIARELNTSVSAVKSLIFRARQKLEGSRL